jgi:hypothetical protein
MTAIWPVKLGLTAITALLHASLALKEMAHSSSGVATMDGQQSLRTYCVQVWHNLERVL